ncbi:MAG: hypothetical protein ACTHJ0_12830 [Flavipsychrobacter sp.]
MKRLLLVLLLTLPLCSSAQTFEIGAAGGFNFHSRPADNVFTTQDKPMLGYTVAAKASLLLPQSQIGVGLEFSKITESNYLMPYYTTKVYNHLANPLITPYLFYNRRLNFTGSYFYYGLMFGPSIAKVGINQLVYVNGNSVPTDYTTTYNSAIGYAAGLQTGFVWHIAGQLSFSLEAAMRFVDYNYKDPGSKQTDNPYHYRYFYFPITAGLRVRI